MDVALGRLRTTILKRVRHNSTFSYENIEIRGLKEFEFSQVSQAGQRDQLKTGVNQRKNMPF